MEYRTLGRTGLRVSVVAVGAGPVSGLMTGHDSERQSAVIQRAVEVGINWVDTAAGYGDGRSEANLGRTLRELSVADKAHVATKVRVTPEACDSPADQIRHSVGDSLERLQLSKVTLLQLHNAITMARGDEAASITPDDVLRTGGVLDAFEGLRAEGVIDFIGLTGTGHPDALKSVVRSGRIDTIQAPYHLLNPSAGRHMPRGFCETNYGNLFEACAAARMGVFAIRVFAAGALLGNPPSAHTHVTPYFPLALYERDRAHAARVTSALRETSLKRVSVEYVLSHPTVTSAIIGFGSPEEVSEVAGIVTDRTLDGDGVAEIESVVDRVR